MAELLRSLDLFSGIAGLTRALEGFAAPAMYCDRAPESIAILTALMRRGCIPTAPICDDVVKLRPEDIEGGIDVIVAGSPCIGFSPMGAKKGFGNEQSGLFKEVLRLVTALEPGMVFLENVPGILRVGMRPIAEWFTARKYRVRWACVAASDVGAAHQRKRWFCLAVRSDFEPPAWGALPAYEGHDWQPGTEPPRMTLEDSRERKLRMGTLGNSVVPDAARAAWLHLTSAGTRPIDTLSPTAWELVPEPAGPVLEGGGKYPPAGAAARAGGPGGVVQIIGMPAPVIAVGAGVPRPRLTFSPHVYETAKAPSKLMTNDVLAEPVAKSNWATPRHGNTSACHFLTTRALRDLGSQVRFEVGTPDELRRGQVSPGFGEWLMGYPGGWTAMS